MNDALTWAMAYILRDLLDEGAIDLSKVDEKKRHNIEVLLNMLRDAIAEVENETD